MAIKQITNIAHCKLLPIRGNQYLMENNQYLMER